MTEVYLWILITTIYGYIMYRRGVSGGVRDFTDVLIGAKIVRDREDLYTKLTKFHDSLEDED